MKVLIVIPIYNEEKILEKNILRLYNFLQNNNLENWQIVIADNASTDQSEKIGQKLNTNYQQIGYLKIPKRGKGIAIRTAWKKYSDADIFTFIDADLSTDITFLPNLINAIAKENYDIAIGDRFDKNSKVKRNLKRNIISLGYRFILKISLKTKINDLPCGFKAINKKILDNIVPLVKNNTWFFDSEIVLLAEKMGYKIKKIPIIWQENREKQNNTPLWSIIKEYLKEILRLKKELKNI